MANDFTQDPNCVAVWKFNDEVDAGIDSLGYNSFTDYTTFGSSPRVRDTSILKEGESSLYISSVTYGPRINNENLNSNFPLKSTSIGSDFSFSIWFRFGKVDKFRYIWSKYNSPTYSGTIAVYVNADNSITVEKKYNDYVAGELFTIPSISVVVNTWYHLTVAYDYSEKTLYVYLIDTSGNILASHTVVQNENIKGSTRQFRLGGIGGSSGDSDVWYDEFVAFNRVISEAEAVLIARGQFPYAQPTTLVPTTLAPTTLAPTTLAPTLAPTTLAPTLAPTTLAPTTLAPTTLAPTTLAPTVAPTTISPTTVSPTTLSPTQAPTTLEPTTLAPTTPFPGVYVSRELNSFINEEDSLNSAINPGNLNSTINAIIDFNSYMDE